MEYGGDWEEPGGTIIVLQQEPQGANEAIELVLRTALLENADGDHVARSRPAADGMGSVASSNKTNGGIDGESSSGTNESNPLFFAIEKQNELKTARHEINRLVNMLGDAESLKQEAYEVTDEMRQKMEGGESRLLLYEKLGMISPAEWGVGERD